MYLPRHTEMKTKSKINFGLFFFLTIVLVSIFLSIWYWKKISFYFSGNSKLKVARIEEQIFPYIEKGKIPKNLIEDFKTISGLYFDSGTTNPSANFFLAKSNYYEVFNSLKISNEEIISINSLNNRIKFIENPKLRNEFEEMYKKALRAKAFSEDFSEKEQNLVLLFLYESIYQKKISDLMNEKLDYQLIPKDLKKIYLILNFFSIPKTGNVINLEKFFILNESEKIINLSNEEKKFLQAVTEFYKNDFVKALELFRESKTELNQVGIEATKYEAEIFAKQNLSEKAILILEDLYQKTGSNNETILIQVKEILKTKTGLKTKLEL